MSAPASATPWPTLDDASAWIHSILPSIPMYLHMLLGALIPIYAGAHASLSRPPSAAQPPKKRPRTDHSSSDDDDEDNGDEEEEIQEMLGWTASDAILLPLTAGVLLLGIYYIITHYGTEVLTRVLGNYFAAVGVVAVTKMVNDAVQVAERFVFPDYYLDAGRVWRVDMGSRKATVVGAPRGGDEGMVRKSPLAWKFGRLPLSESALGTLWSVREKARQRYVVRAYVEGHLGFRAVLTLINVLTALAGVAVVLRGADALPSWLVKNLQVSALAYLILQSASPTSFRIGSLVLMTLLVYDIVMVFFTPVMETVAMSLALPAMMEFPGPTTPSEEPDRPAVRQTRMLGGGDVMIPGLMMALALRFDLYMFYLKKQKKAINPVADSQGPEGKKAVQKAPYVSVSRRWGERVWITGAAQSSLPDALSGFFPKTYFTASVVGYVAGLVVTLVVLSIWKRGQPALLYLVPGVVGSLWGTAFVRGELKHMWEFTEQITAEQLNEDSSDASKGKGKEVTEKAKSSNEPAADDKSATPAKSSKDPELVLSFTIRRRAARKSQPS